MNITRTSTRIADLHQRLAGLSGIPQLKGVKAAPLLTGPDLTATQSSAAGGLRELGYQCLDTAFGYIVEDGFVLESAKGFTAYFSDSVGGAVNRTIY